MTRFMPSPSSSSALKFIDAALCTTGSFSLSYLNQDLKWVIREHLRSLIAEFPSLSASLDQFAVEDGTRARLLFVSGVLPLSRSDTSLLVKITLHPSYPFVPPAVSLSSSLEIDWSNPLVDASSGTACTPYLKAWSYPGSNLVDLVRNLRKLFKLWPPFVFPKESPTSLGVAPQSRWAFWVSKREAIDRLYVSLSQDLAAFRDIAGKEIDSLGIIRDKLKERSWVALNMAEELGREKEKLLDAVKDMERRAQTVKEWVEVNGSVPSAVAEVQPEDCFLVVGQESLALLDNAAEALAIEDVVEALDMALREKVIECGDYVKQVRELFRKHFCHSFPQGSFLPSFSGMVV